MVDDMRRDLVEAWRERLASGEFTGLDEENCIDEILAEERVGRLLQDINGLDESLKRDHRMSRLQAWIAFALSCALVLLGTLVIFDLIQIFGSDPGSLSVVVGVITGALSALPFWMWRQAMAQAESIRDTMKRESGLRRAIKSLPLLPPESQGAAASEIVRCLLGGATSPAQLNSTP